MSASVIASVQQMQTEMGSLLNTHRYVFAAQIRRARRFDLSSFASGTGSTTTADTSYYKGDDEIASVKVADDQTVSYGITADHPAFEQDMRVLKFVANSRTLSSTDITNAFSLASSALDATATAQAKLSSASSRIEPAKSRQSDYRSCAQTLASVLTGVDAAAVTAQLSAYHAQLSASCSTLAKIESLNLASCPK